MNHSVSIQSDGITLGQFLKLIDVIQSGGYARDFLEEHPVTVNGEREKRRGKKLHDGDIVIVESNTYVVSVNAAKL